MHKDNPATGAPQVRGIANMPSWHFPWTDPDSEAGETWIVFSHEHKRLATMYRSLSGGYGADVTADAGIPAALLIVGAGLPRLPYTRPDDMSTDPVSWNEVRAEVAEALRASGWLPQ
jgi:hypothetical protein